MSPFIWFHSCLTNVGRPSLISLTLLYTSLPPLILQLVLSIWYTPNSSPHESLPSSSSLTLPSIIPHQVFQLLPPNIVVAVVELGEELTRIWDGVNRVWAGTRLLGGMSAGFGLRVLLPTKPWETTSVVLAGWMAAALVERTLSGTG